MFKWLGGLFSKKDPFAGFPMDGHLVADLDKMITEPVPFKWNGKIHFIRPIDVKEFLRVTEGLVALDQMRAADKITAEQLIEGYSRVIGAVCNTIGKNEIRKMTQPQVGALYQLVIDSITGKVHGTEKKSLRFVTDSEATAMSQTAGS